jgi:hypothetical protein
MRAPSVIGWALVVALVWVCAVALYRSIIIVKGGHSLGSVPLFALVTDVMNLHWHAVYGFLAGGLVGALEWLLVSIRDRLRRRRSERTHSGDLDDVDLKLKLARASRATSYLEARAAGRRAASLGGEPPIENVVTARNGTITYRVLAYRPLSPSETREVVRDALRSGRVREPEPGGMRTIITDIE